MIQKKVIAVQFKNKRGEGFWGNKYSYYTDVPLTAGQLVKVPTKNGDSLAKVVEVDVDIETIPKMIRCYLKTITESCLVLDADGNPEMDAQQTFDGFFN